MKGVTYYLAFSIFLSAPARVCNFCPLENRHQASNASDDFAWYEPTFLNSSLSDCGCENIYTCVRKCCDLNYVFGENFTCVFNNQTDLQVNVYKYRNVLIDDDSVKTRFIPGLNPCTLEEDEHGPLELKYAHVQRDGRLWIAFVDAFLEHKHYCIEKTEDGLEIVVFCVRGYDVESLITILWTTVIGMLISFPFLLVTFVVYAILPVRNVHSKALMCYVFSLFGSWLIYVFFQLYTEALDPNVIRTFLMTFYYLGMSSFFWMNVMCIDIYLTFSGSRRHDTNSRKSERKRFLIYSTYAWGSPLMLLFLVLAMSSVAEPYKWYNPGVMDDELCWLSDGIPTFVYLYLPMMVLIVTNMVLFVITACHIRQVRQDTAVLRDGDNKTSKKEDQMRFGVYLKLCAAMGVNWSMEIISWALKWQIERIPTAVWYVSEFCNAAFGVFIFFIFVFNKKTWRLLKTRYYQIRDRRQPNHGETSTAITRSHSSIRQQPGSS